MKEHRVVRSVSPEEFKTLMNYLAKEHALIKGCNVKYLTTTFDFRTNEFWRLEFKCFGQFKEFTAVNREVGDSPYDCLFDEIMGWLKDQERSL